MALPLAARDGLAIGSLINGKYRLLEQIGAGGMGKIYKAAQLPLERAVAIKVVHPHLGQQGSSAGGSRSEGETFQKRFFLEASALSQLRHRNIVTVFDYGQIEGRDSFFMVMEYLQGAPLSAQLRGGQRMAVPAVLGMIRQVGRGLREVHKIGMVHRDLKPANIFLVQEDDESLYKLLDFGLVKQTQQQAGNPDELTEAGALLGSPTYMSPEQIDGAPVDRRSDLYSLGAMAFHCLTGKPPFEGSLTQVMLQHVHKEAPALAVQCPEGAFSPELERLLARCLAKRPEGRYQSIDELFEDLRVCEARYGVAGPTAPLASGSYPGASTGSFSGVPSATGSGSFSGLPSATGAGASGAGSFLDGPPTPTGPGSRSGLPSATHGGRAAPAKAPDEPGSMPSLASTEGPTRVDFPTPPSSKKSAGVVVGVALGVLLLGAVAVALRPSSPAEGAGGRVLSPGPSAGPVASHEASPAPRLVLGSIPEGAQVLDGERLLGITPLEIPLDGAAGRSLTLRLEGHEPFAIGALPTETTRMVIPLKAAPVERAPKGARYAPQIARPVPPKTTAPPDQPPPPAIRMTR